MRGPMACTSETAPTALPSVQFSGKVIGRKHDKRTSNAKYRKHIESESIVEIVPPTTFYGSLSRRPVP